MSDSSIRVIALRLFVLLVLVLVTGCRDNARVDLRSNNELRAWGACPDLVVELSGRIYPRLERVAFSSLNSSEQAIIAINSLENEVYNGGFAQWLFNSSGDYAGQTAECLRRIGDDDVANLVEKACQVFGPSGPAADCADRRQQMKLLPDTAYEVFEACDTAYSELEKSMLERFYAFALEHLEEIRLP